MLDPPAAPAMASFHPLWLGWPCLVLFTDNQVSGRLAIDVPRRSIGPQRHFDTRRVPQNIV